MASSERTARKISLGKRGERLAAEYLVQQGYAVLTTNWRCREGELDIIGHDGETLVICEVKTRSGVGFGTPQESVTRHKVTCIRRATSKWLNTYKVPFGPVRFDVIAVYIPPGEKPRLRHIPGAF